MADAPAPLTLQEHLSGGYDFYVRGRLKPWNKQVFVDALKADPELVTQARARLAEVGAVVRAGRRCFVSETYKRVLEDALKAVDA